MPNSRSSTGIPLVQGLQGKQELQKQAKKHAKPAKIQAKPAESHIFVIVIHFFYKNRLRVQVESRIKKLNE